MLAKVPQKLSVWVDSAWHLLNPQLLLARYVCAKSLQLCQTLCGPLNYTARQAHCPWDSPGKNIGAGCHALPEKATATHSSTLAWKDGGAWWAAVHGVAKSQTQLSDFPFTFHFHALEKEMATHSSVLAWRIPGMVEPGGLPSMGSHRVGHD